MFDFKGIGFLVVAGLIAIAVCMTFVPAALLWGLGWLIAPRVGEWSLVAGQWTGIAWAVLVGGFLLGAAALDMINRWRD